MAKLTIVDNGIVVEKFTDEQIETIELAIYQWLEGYSAIQRDEDTSEGDFLVEQLESKAPAWGILGKLQRWQLIGRDESYPADENDGNLPTDTTRMYRTEGET